jgi:hypothetical protein
MTTVFIVMNIILLFPLSAIACGIYYAELVYKIGLVLFSIPWLGAGVVINISLFALLIDRTLIDVNVKQIKISQAIKRVENSFLILQAEEITGLKISTSNKESHDKFPDLIIVANDNEHSLNKFTSFVFTNEEIVLLANKINKYIKVNIF